MKNIPMEPKNFLQEKIHVEVTSPNARYPMTEADVARGPLRQLLPLHRIAHIPTRVAPDDTDHDRMENGAWYF